MRRLLFLSSFGSGLRSFFLLLFESGLFFLALSFFALFGILLEEPTEVLCQQVGCVVAARKHEAMK